MLAAQRAVHGGVTALVAVGDVGSVVEKPGHNFFVARRRGRDALPVKRYPLTISFGALSSRNVTNSAWRRTPPVVHLANFISATVSDLSQT